MGTTGRENRKKGTPAPRKSGAAPHVAAKQKPGAAAVPAVDAEPREPLIPPHVARFLASIPMTPDPVEWILGFRAALQELLGDVDRIAMQVDTYCPLDDISGGEAWFHLYLDHAVHGSGTGTMITLRPGDEQEHHARLLMRLQHAGHDLGIYRPPIGTDFAFRNARYLASILLFRERHRPAITAGTQAALEVLRPFIVYACSSLVARFMVTQPAKHLGSRMFRRIFNDYGLSEGEKHVVALKAIGLTSAAIATRLYITQHAVKKRLESIRRKTGTAGIFELFMRHLPTEGA
ncbi:MAG TPA: hypothetical protein VHI13_04580 [Candidatus Kapabacteria bacterium]|nr:hypothetical protein [Candidatus Kapabacteria bacterium]